MLTEEVPAQQYLEIDEVTPDSFRVSWHPLSADEGQHKLMWIPVYGGRTEEVSGGGRKVPQGVLAGFPGGSAVKNPPAMREARGRSLGQQHPPEKGMATHSSILFWEIPWTEEPTVHGVAKSRTRLSD